MIKSAHILKWFFIVLITIISCNIGRSQSPSFISSPIKNKVYFKAQKEHPVYTLKKPLAPGANSRINSPKDNQAPCPEDRKGKDKSDPDLNASLEGSLKIRKKDSLPYTFKNWPLIKK